MSHYVLRIGAGVGVWDVDVWGIWELTFTGPSGLSNPFTGASATVVFTGPSAQTYTVDMFYDGNGVGGQTGTVWLARFMPDEEGEWTWEAFSATPQLDGETGNFVAGDGGLPGSFEIDPDFPFAIRRKTGEHELLIGDALAFDSSPAVDIVYFYPGLGATRQADIRQFHTDRHLNMLPIILYNEDFDLPYGPFIGSFESWDFTRMSLPTMHEWEAMFDEIEAAGLLAEVWFHSDDSSFIGQTPYLELIKYIVARFGARRSIPAWVVGLEAEEYLSGAQMTLMGEQTMNKDPYGRPIGMHFGPGNNLVRTESWQTYIPIQFGFSNTPAQMNSMIETNRDVTKPTYAAEFGNEVNTDAEVRKRMWAAFVSGAFVIGNTPGQYYESGGVNDSLEAIHMADYCNADVAPGSRPEWWKMTPADSLVTSGSGFLLRETNVRYLCYCPTGGTVQINLAAASGGFTYDWYNVRTGAITTGSTTTGGATRTFVAPDANDWLLDIRRT